MSKSLPHISEKLRRASEHIAQLKSELRAFEHEAPYGPIINDNADTAKAFQERWDQRVIPVRFSLIVGEVIYQLRSSLDHIHAALIRHDGGTLNTTTQFPIFLNKPTTSRQVGLYKARLGGIRRRKVLASIKRHQPYTRRTRDDGKKWLGIMNTMGNADKHQAPVLCISVIDPKLRLVTIHPGYGFQGESYTRDDGAPVAPSLPFGGDFIEIVNMERRLSAYVAFAKWDDAPYPLPVGETLSQLHKAVSGLTEELLSFLP